MLLLTCAEQLQQADMSNSDGVQTLECCCVAKRANGLTTFLSLISFEGGSL